MSGSRGYTLVDGSASTSMESGSQGKLLSRGTIDKYSSTYVPHDRLSRYTTAISNLIPVRFRRVPGSEIPVDKIGLFSSVSFNWLNEYVSAGYKKRIGEKPLPTVSLQESCQINGPRIDSLWHNDIVKRGQSGASVPSIAWQFVKTRVLVSSLIHLLGMIIALCSPILVLQRIIYSTEDRLQVFPDPAPPKNSSSLPPAAPSTLNTTRSIEISEDFERIILMDNVIISTHVVLLISVETISYFLIAWSAAMNLRTATRLRSACLALAYRKLLRSSVRYAAPVHQTLTYFVPDSNTLFELISNGPLIFSGPLILLLSSLFIWHSMGHWALIGIAVLVVLYFGLILSAYLTKVFATRAMKFSLRRISLLQEFIEKICIAKIGKYDKRFASGIRTIREMELKEMKLGALSEGWSLCMVHVIPIVTVSAMTMAYLINHNYVVSANYIPCLVLILLNLKHCVRSSWLAMSSISRGVASLNKLKAILILKDTNRFTDKPIDRNLAIAINGGTFTWSQDNSPVDRIIRSSSQFILDETPTQMTNLSPSHTLLEVNFYAPKGRLIGVCGSSKSGKSSLLQAIMGQLHHAGGHVAIDGSCSYVPEEAGLFEGTLKENIILGEAFDASWYYKTIQACRLNEDLNSLPGSDDTDVSTVELTNCQRQKIALARAVYNNRDINLLDNPLGDVERPEGTEIFEKAIVQLLGEKCVILVSDKIQFLNRCDTIYVMKEGKIVEQGSHDELLQWNSEYTDLIKTFGRRQEGTINKDAAESVRGKHLSNGPSISDSILDISTQVERDSDEEGGTRMDRLKSELKYKAYINGNRGWWHGAIVCTLSLLYSIPIAAAPLVFTYIAQKMLTNTTMIAVILAFMVGFIIFWGLILMIIYNEDVFTSARNIHELWLQKINKAQISVFSTASSIILLNIFSLNLQEVDYMLPRLKITALTHVGISFFSIIILGILSPWLLLPAIIFMSAMFAYNFYVRGLLLALYELKIHSVTPIYTHTINTVRERAVIQAYRKEREFSKKFYKHCNANLAYDFLLDALKLWVEFRIKFLSALTLAIIMIICASLSAIKVRYEVLGLAFICTLQLTQSVIHLTGAVMSGNGSLLTIGVVDKYIMNIPQEKTEGDNIRKQWPAVPDIHFQDVLLSTNSPIDQEPLNFSIYAGEKVAFRGLDPELQRDLVKCLLQINEVFAGNIIIGSLKIFDISIEVLRDHVDYIPKVPVLFDGTVRYNVDPNRRNSEKTVVKTLQKMLLWEKIVKLDERLDNDTSNIFSLVEKKLLLLARIYLKSVAFSKHIIIIEELDQDAEILDGLFQDVLKQFTVIVLSSKSSWNAQRVIRLNDHKTIKTATTSPSSPAASTLLSVPKNIETSF
ncbi:multidrug resistance-associated protein 9 [Diachasma alloeum]|uniref:multidrug resistance-associated protein 9 n=1 Tax=Diachasma alloeum TaxID=454923 RepID=UPI00073834DA|nr:multidrug resistance-associated protein 9 [Diachasma alloeum]